MMTFSRLVLTGFLIVVSVLVTPTKAAWADSGGEQLRVLVCYPGGPVRTTDAKPAMDSMLRVIEETGQWPHGVLTSQFTSKVDECRRLLKELDPHFAILSIGLFLESRVEHHLVPVARPNIKGKTTDVYRILVKKGQFATLDSLAGKTLGGTHLAELGFLKKIVLKNQLDPGKHFNLKPSRRALRALRKLAKGKLDAVIVNQQQFQSLGSLPFAAELAPIFASDPIPLVGLLANSNKTTQSDRSRLTQALSSMCTHRKGRELCELFGVEAFVPADISTYKKVMELWQAKR